MIPNRADGQAWPLRPFGQYPNVYVSTTTNEGVALVEPTRNQMIVLSRRDARLLAKRINQCLDETRKGRRKP